MYHKTFIMEKRTADGRLDLSQPQPPFLICTENEIFDYYFKHGATDDESSASQETVREWYARQGFTWRLKTW